MKTISVTAHFDGEPTRLDGLLGLEPLNLGAYLACAFFAANSPENYRNHAKM